MKQHMIFVAVLASCVSCTTVSPSQNDAADKGMPMATSERPEPPKGCSPDSLAQYVGQPIAEVQPKLDTRDIRILRPGMMRTMDYRPTRLNVDVDNNGAIARFWCG